MLYAALILLSLIWGGSFFFIKQLLEHFGPWTIAFLRSALGFATITFLMLILRKPFDLRRMPWLLIAIVALVNTAIPWAVIGFSETRLTSSMTSILNATTPLWTVVVGALFFKATTHRMQWIGLAIAFVGLIILLGINPVSIISIDGIGFLCMMTATLCYAVGSQLSARLQQLSMYQISFGTLLCAMVSCGGMALSTETISWTSVSSLTILPLLIGLGVFGSGIGYILFYYMIQKGSPEFATTVTYLVPASAIIWGATLLDEKVHWNMLIGVTFILAGVYLSNRSRKYAERASDSASSSV
ncbi:drug/metabolite transporter (DMT)-like permease [Paenibacillus shirakamiensis]|uniref:Drug/metabolite transporter (DMT)-like permease n=2 Tax=Paenibacillus shirakamiensis TaxID=1265935 RepID=A0ABS4JFU6_9BACL|nr:drug/metabolite transporter (DMT)-like permease [Paenibacillus shirakamiensis]